MGTGALLRRVRAAPVVFGSIAVVATLALTLLAAGPVYSDAVAVGALRQRLADVPVADTAVAISARVDATELEAFDETVTRMLDQAFGDVARTDQHSIVSAESFELPDQPGERVDLARLAWIDGVRDHVDVVAGSLPGSSGAADDSDAVLVAVHADAATELGLTVGRELTVAPRSGDAEPVRIRVAAVYEVPEPTVPFWTGRERFAVPYTVTPSFRTSTLLVDEPTMTAGVSPRPNVEVVALPRFDDVDLDDVRPLRRSLSRLEGAVETAVVRDGPASTSALEVQTSAPGVLVDSDRALTVARSVVFAVIVQVAVLAAFALVLVAGIGVDARESETNRLRARGASSIQLVGQAAIDAVVVVAPAAAVAPFLATWLTGLLDDFGPLAGNGLVLDPSPVSTAWVVVLVAATITVLLLSWPAVRAARARDATLRPSRRRSLRGGLQRSGLDLAVLLLAAVAYWQLRTLDDARSASLRDRFGVDPLLVLAPTFGLVAGAFLALRIVPAGARWAERLVVRSRSAPAALAGWQLARRPDRYSRASLLMIMAIALGAFALSYDATWTESQTAQAAQDLGTPGRLEPNRRTGDSIEPIVLPPVLESQPGVAEAGAVLRGSALLPASDRSAEFLAVDAARPDLIVGELRRRDRVLVAVDALVRRRPDVDAIAIPGSPAALELQLNAPVEPEPDVVEEDVTDGEATADEAVDEPPPPPPEPFAGTVSLVVRDADGLVHRLDGGAIGPGGNDLVFELSARLDDGSLVPARAPLDVVGLDIGSPARRVAGEDLEVALGPLVAVDVDGSRTSVPWVASDLLASTEVFGFLGTQAGMTIDEERTDGGLIVTIAPGATAFGIVPVVHTLEPRSIAGEQADAVPVVVSASWLTESGTAVGDVVPMSLGRSDDVRVEVVDVVDAVPSIDPTMVDAVLVDLPTLLWSEREPGRSPREPSEYWFAEDGEVDSVALALPPVEATSVELVRERIDRLLSDPAAVASIGALLLGFLAAASFALVGFLVTVAVSASERRVEFGLLSALGLTAGQRRRWLSLERLILVVTAVGLGTFLGWLLARLILPVVSLSNDGTSVYPSVVTIIPWGRVLVLDAVVMSGLIVGGLLAMRTQGDVSSARRGGDE